MLKSMTGFGTGEAENSDYRVRAEIRSVNQRFLELSFRMPRILYPWEEAMRKCLKNRITRGKLEILISFSDMRDSAVSVRVNKALVLAYQKALNDMCGLLKMARPDEVSAVANYPDVITVENNASLEGIEEVLLPALETALEELDLMRTREGEAIDRDFDERLGTLGRFLDELEDLAPGIVSDYRSRIEKGISEMLSSENIDNDRILQETAIYADKVDFTEEIVRLRSHFDQFRLIKESGTPVGRKLDFLTQEMNREVNTVGSKAYSANAARIVVEMKSEIEKLREQIQNIE